MMAEMWRGWPAPAKLNLFLHITGRRADGYHELQTLFQFVDFGDVLDFQPRSDREIRRARPLPGVAEAQDLTVRAARALAARCGDAARGVDIQVHKRLPLGGGLGGGSSDAATTLVALNHLWGCGLATDALAELGLALGADVPVFVRGRAAWAEGVGERLEPVRLPEPWFVVLAPGVTVSTAEVFCAPELIRNSRPITIRAFLAGAGQNVCEPVVRARYPDVDRALRALAAYGEARMTGTGACVFAAFPSEAAARATWSALQSEWTGFVAPARNRSPLAERLRAERGAASGSPQAD